MPGLFFTAWNGQGERESSEKKKSFVAKESFIPYFAAAVSHASVLVVSLFMGLVVLGELIAIVGALLEAEHAQPSC